MLEIADKMVDDRESTISNEHLKERAATPKTSMNYKLEEVPLRGGASEANPDRNPNHRPTSKHRDSVHDAGKANTPGTNAPQRKPHAIAATKRVISEHSVFPSQ